MYRVQMPGRQVSDMVNLTRAKDAAMCLALLMRLPISAATNQRFSSLADYARCGDVAAGTLSRLSRRASQARSMRKKVATTPIAAPNIT